MKIVICGEYRGSERNNEMTEYHVFHSETILTTGYRPWSVDSGDFNINFFLLSESDFKSQAFQFYVETCGQRKKEKRLRQRLDSQTNLIEELFDSIHELELELELNDQ